MAKGNYHYFVHYARRLQDNNADVLTIVSGDKGLGKSSTAITLAIDYIKKYGFVCPKCGSEFYKNVYSIENRTNPPTFYLSQKLLKVKWLIKCPEEYVLDMKTGIKKRLRVAITHFLIVKGKKLNGRQRNSLHMITRM